MNNPSSPGIKSPGKKICILRMSALGDCILLVPLIRRIQKFLPDAEITWIIDKQLFTLLAGVDGVKFIPIEKPRTLSDYLNLRKRMQGLEFDLLLATQASLRANLIYPFIKAKQKVGFDKKRGRELHHFFIDTPIEFAEEHLLEGFQAFGTALLLPKVSNPEWNIELPNDDKAWASDQLSHFEQNLGVPKTSPWIVINPSASKIERCCSPDFYGRLIDRLQTQFTAKIVMTGGPSSWEQELADDILANLEVDKRGRVLNLVGKTSLRQLAALLAQVDLLIAPDTGPVHVADAFGTKVVGLYAVITPKLSGPFQSQHLVVDKYEEAAEHFLGINADKIPWGKRVHHDSAMSLFELKEVLEKVQLALSGA